MAAFLIFSAGTGIERVPCGSVTAIGRDRSNEIVLGDRQVSRNHAMVRRLGEADYYLIDSGSSNGSWINRQRITTPVLLRDGDRILVGSTEFLFEQAPQSTAAMDPAQFEATVVMHSPLIREITLLVADMRGFTSLSEQLPIQQLTQVMNQWFHNVSDIISDHRGVVDKFIGDCVFARWESDKSCNNVSDALRAACLIGESTAALSTTFPDLPGPLRIGAGINTGLASLGIGSENTALGDSVNTAFRLEAASKELETDIVLSESSYSCLSGNTWHGAQRQLRLKGKRKPVNVVALRFEEAHALLANVERQGLIAD